MTADRSRSRRVLLVFAVLLVIVMVAAMFARARRRPRSAGPQTTTATEQPTSPPTASGTTTAMPSTAPRAQGTSTDGGSAPVVDATPLIPWGSGPQALGRDRPQEANAEAPMSLVALPGGGSLVLDQVNGRLVRFDKDGRPTSTIKLPLQAPQDLAVARDGSIAVLDRLVDGAVAVLDPQGRPRGELKLEGKEIKEGGAVTGVFVDGNDVWVEREHETLVRLGDVKGKPDAARTTAPGRPSVDGKLWLGAGIIQPQEGSFFVTAFERGETQKHRFTRRIVAGAPIRALMLLDSDRFGTIYAGFLLGDAQTPGEVMVICLSPLDGRPQGRIEFPANEGPDETFRELTVADEGGVLFLARDDRGARLQHGTCR